MYANLKHLMRSKGYVVSEGDDWASTDTAIFQGFATRELGVPLSRVSHLMAYPQAFPAALEQALVISDSVGAPIPAAAPAPEPAPAYEPIPTPAAAPIDSDSGVFDLNPAEQQAKQDLDPVVGAPADISGANESSESAPDDEAEESDTPPADTEESETPPVEQSADEGEEAAADSDETEE